jgi:CubicO group peptidase (beta-lactamase class C family)
MRFLTILATGAVVAFAAAPATSAPPPVTEVTLDTLIANRMADAGIMGVAAAVIVDHQVVWMKGYGFADYERTRPFTPNTVMNIGSISKTVTGVAMMHAVQEGRLALDADINQYLPFKVIHPHHPDAVITLRHLATHTSGITDRPEAYHGCYHWGGEKPEPLGGFLTGYFKPGGTHYSPDNFLNERPGAVREYSNIGASLAGWIVERAVGASLPDYARRTIFAPLQMTNTAWRLSEVKPGAHSTLFVPQNGTVIPIQQYELTTYPDGGVRSSVSDLSKFFIALLSGGAYQGTRILDAKLAAEMTRFQFTDANRPTNYPASEGNSGLFWRTKFDGKRVGHGGNDPGMIADMLADRSGKIAVILFTNTSLGGSDRRLYGQIFEALWAHGESVKARAR